jgi:hypothetical protein
MANNKYKRPFIEADLLELKLKDVAKFMKQQAYSTPHNMVVGCQGEGEMTTTYDFISCMFECIADH